MRKNDAQEILRLQLKGYGYKRIAVLLGLPVNTVKSHCRRHPISAQRDKSMAVCLNCKASIEQIPHRKRKKFCSDKCRSAWWNSNPSVNGGKESCICAMCGEVFESYKSKNRKYCSRKCYDKMRGVLSCEQ